MKKMVNGVLLTLALCGVSGLAQAEKIGVVDMNAVFQKLPQREAVTQKMQTEFGDRVASMQKMQTDLGQMMEKHQRDVSLMSASDKTKLERDIESTRSDLQLQGKALEEDMNKRQNEEQNKILAQVQTVVDKIAKDENYDLILQRGAALYVKAGADISDKVVSELSK